MPRNSEDSSGRSEGSSVELVQRNKTGEASKNDTTLRRNHSHEDQDGFQPVLPKRKGKRKTSNPPVSQDEIPDKFAFSGTQAAKNKAKKGIKLGDAAADRRNSQTINFPKVPAAQRGAHQLTGFSKATVAQPKVSQWINSQKTNISQHKTKDVKSQHAIATTSEPKAITQQKLRKEKIEEQDSLQKVPIAVEDKADSKQKASNGDEGKLKANSVSEQVFKALSFRCIFIVTCSDCASEKIHREHHIPHSDCQEDNLMGRTVTEECFTAIRQSPRSYEAGRALCEKAYGKCPRKNACDHPHSETERLLWDCCAKERWSIVKFQQDLNVLILRKTIDDIIHKECELDLVCSECWDKDRNADCSKIKHKPLCKVGHKMTDSKTTLVLRCKNNNRVAVPIEIDTFPLNDDMDLKSLAEQLKKLLQIKYKKETLLRQYQSIRQRVKSFKGKEKQNNKIYPRIDDEFMPSKTEKTKYRRRVIYDTDFEDIITGVDIDSEEELSDDEYIPKEEDKAHLKYSLKPVSECRRLLASEPTKYKLCTIHLDGSQNATCTPLDEKTPKIKIHGRHNCGTAFDGDEVVVKIKKWLDTETEKLHVGGRVKCITKQCTKREEYMFVCVVDDFSSSLMVPLCGKAPKIHIYNSQVRDHNFKDINFNNQLVNVCEKDSCGKISSVPDRETPISAKLRSDKLFIVKYEKWDERNRYPFGYVVKVIHAGDNLERGSLVLKLMYQIPANLPDQPFRADYGRKIKQLSQKENRLDLKDLIMFSIDPDGSTDIDDALSVEAIESDEMELYKVGIHIADVTALVPRHCEIDTYASKRRTSYYPLENEGTIHMLPESLATNYCSLLQEHTRLAISCFVTMNKDGIIQRKPSFHESVVCNKRAFTYKEANNIILGRNDEDTTFSDPMRVLFRIALELRAKRKSNPAVNSDRSTWLQFPPGELGDHECHAHMLVDEFMLLVNSFAARRIAENEPKFCILRRQLQPSKEDMKNYIENHGNWIDSCLFMRPYQQCITKYRHENVEVISTGNTNITLLRQIVPLLKTAAETHDRLSMIEQLSKLELIPSAFVSQVEWFRIQSPAEVAVLEKHRICGHFSLQTQYYTWFSSPIRRYIDMVNHRILKAIIRKQSMPYYKDELMYICRKFNRTIYRQKMFSQELLRLKALNFLKDYPIYIPCPIASVDDEAVQFIIPFLPHIRASESKLHYGKLVLSGTPEGAKTGKPLRWERRIYETKETDYGRLQQDSIKKLNSKWHTVEVSQDDWNSLMTYACSGQTKQGTSFSSQQEIPQEAGRILENMRFNRNVEVTSEMKESVPIVKHPAKFQVTWSPASVVQLQIGAMCKEGMLEAGINRICLTEKLHHCHEHMNNPITCFAEVAEKKSKKLYLDIKEYQETWLPILCMEAITNAAHDSDPVTVRDVPIAIWKHNNDYFGHLEFNRNFLTARAIHFITHDSEEEEDSQDYLCLRVPIKNSSHYLPPGNESIKPYINLTNQWTAHALITEVHRESKGVDGEDDNTDVRQKGGEDKQTMQAETVRVSFKLHHFNAKMTQQLLKGSTSDVCNGTIELFSKSLPDRRMFNAVMTLRDTTEFCEDIVLGTVLNIKKMLMEKDWLELIPTGPESLDIEVRMARDKRNRFQPLYPNNAAQDEAIRQALSRRFTVIQGPPGTGKTLTGVKLLYWFATLNKKLEKKDAFKRQVMYCGPSNSAVDVATKLMKYRLAEKCPKIVRVFSENIHKQSFPVPRYYTSSNKRRDYDGLSEAEMKDLALHYLIRDERRQGARASEIQKYDKLFREKPPEKIKDAEIAHYRTLVKEASIDELAKYDVILCTCSVSASPRIQRGCHITQCVIDECGMCMEPETLVPLVSLKPQPNQVVLIGDHKQLRPIVKNQTACQLGLDKSLFERYATMEAGLIMLNEQYRMNEKICDFPSKHFYEGKLKTHLTNYWYAEGEIATEVWPNKAPFVFCHVEGVEESQAIATPEGNEQSKWNKADAAHAIRIFLEFTGTLNVNYKRIVILSQYKAQMKYIEKELKDCGYTHPNVSTVVSSQGDEWDYVILSTVRSLPPYEIDKWPSQGWLNRHLGFITDHNQINVALTRAKKGLVIIGNKHLLRCDNDPKKGLWVKLLDYYEKKGCLVDADKFPRRRDELSFRHRKMHTYTPYGKTVPEENPDLREFPDRDLVPPRYQEKLLKREY